MNTFINAFFDSVIPSKVLYTIGLLVRISNGKSSTLPYSLLYIHNILDQLIAFAANPTSRRTLGFGVGLQLLSEFMILISATNMSHLSILLKILSAKSGVPISLRLSLSRENSDTSIISFFNCFIAFFKQYSIKFLFLVLDKSDCQE